MTPAGLTVGVIRILITWVLPIALIIKGRWVGFVLGILLVWFAPLIGAEFLRLADSEYETGMLQAASLAGGWLPAIVYCGGVLGVVTLVNRVKRAREVKG